MTPAEPILYFAYGSNLDPDQVAERMGGPFPSRRGRLPGYRIAFDMREGEENFANVVAHPDAPDGLEAGVWGVVYACTEEALGEMDVFECVAEGQYARARVLVHLEDGGTVAAVTYVALPPFAGVEGRPEDAYLDRIVRGARHHGLSEAWIEVILRVAGRP